MAFVAAYLLVLQAAVSGVAAQQMHARADIAAGVICLNGDGGPAGSGERQAAPFDCCGAGCLVGAHALEGPSPPDRALSYPSDGGFELRVAARSVAARPSPIEGAGPRAPPTFG